MGARSSASAQFMLLQPIVENAIVYGLEPKIDGGTVTIRAAADGGSCKSWCATPGSPCLTLLPQAPAPERRNA
jgi:hypothetical protein